MTSGWEGIRGEIERILLGEEHDALVGIPRLTGWREQAAWVRLLGDRRFRRGDQEATEATPQLVMAPILATLWRLGTVVVVAVRWDGREYHFHVGRAASSRYGPASLLGSFPPDLLDDLVVEASDPLNAVLGCSGHGMKLIGRPTAALAADAASPLEAMAAAAGVDPVAFMGVLTPVKQEEAVASSLELQSRLSRLVSPEQKMETDLVTRSLLQMVSDEVDHRLGGMGAGLWKHHGFLLTSNEDVLHRAAGAVTCALTVETVTGGPVLDWRDAEPHRPDPGATTWLRTEEAAALYACPTRPLPGFAIETTCPFDVPRREAHPGRQLELGRIQVRRSGEQPFDLHLDELQRHLLICGVTGSGKTQTSFHVLLHLWLDHNVPWLVIEPVKGDYWRLARALVEPDRQAALSTIRVLTLGDASPERSNPISLNPFFFPQEIPLSTHLDLLKSVFFAGFVLYPPMPYVLETALVRTYEKKGWDLITSDWGGGRREARIPTLTEFIASVEEVVRGLGWSGEMQDNIRSSLLVRLNNLRRGGKGLFLDGPSTWTIDRLLDRPTVLELGAFGSDEEKAFVSGLIFGLLAEWREAEARRREPPEGLRHVLVIEEAHRLFRRTNTDQGAEGGNVRGQAVERVAGLLTEIRSYGQGVVIIDQSPEKLAPDAVRNTGTKIIHRIVAAEDRETMARAANLSLAQERELVVLPPGQAVLAAEQIREPVLVRVPLTRFSTQSPKDRLNLLLADARKTESFGGTAAPFGTACQGCRAVAEGRCGATRAQTRHELTSKEGSGRVIPGFWLLGAGSMKIPLDEALSRSLDGTALDGDPAHRQCAAAQIASLTIPVLLDRQPQLRTKADALQDQLESTLADGNLLTEKRCLGFQGGSYFFDRCADWCALPCLYGGPVFRMPPLHGDLRRAAQAEFDAPSSKPERIMILFEAKVDAWAKFDGLVPKPVAVCALMVLTHDLKGSIAAKKKFVDRVMKAWLAAKGRPGP